MKLFKVKIEMANGRKWVRYFTNFPSVETLILRTTPRIRKATCDLNSFIKRLSNDAWVSFNRDGDKRQEVLHLGCVLGVATVKERNLYDNSGLE